VRLATFNVMGGRGLADGRVDPARLAGAVGSLDADLLGLQEVDRDQPRSGGVDLAGVAATAMGAAAYRFAPALVGTPGAAWQAATAGTDGAGAPCYGVALLSRYPVRWWRVLRLPAAPVRAPVYVPGPGGGLLLLADEPRVVLAARVAAPGGELTVACTHLSFVPGWNGYHLGLTLRALRRLPGPRVLLGDLNLPGALVRLVPGWRALAHRATYPAPAPRVQFDHVLADRVPAAPVRVWCPRLPVSDHRPLVVRLDPAAGTGGWR